MNMSPRQCGLQDARRGYGCTPRKVVAHEDVDEYEMTNEEVRAYLTAYEKEELVDAGLKEWTTVHFSDQVKNHREDAW